MSGATGAIIAGSVVAAGTSVYSANKAAGATSKAAKSANSEEARQFDLVRGDTAKLRGLGDSAIDRINRLYGYGSAAQPAQASASPLSYSEFIASRGGTEGFGRGGGRFGPVMDEVGARRAYQQYLQSQPAAVPAAPATGTGQPDMSAFFESPDYQFRLSQGEQGINRAAAARGRYDSGAVLKGLDRYNSNLASGEFASFYDRLAQQAGLGVTGIGQSAAAGANAANNIGANLVNAGNSRASAYLTAGQGVNNAVQGGIQNWYLNRYLNQPAVAGG